MGMWTNEYDDKLDWQRHKGHTSTMETGPYADHTLGNKVYEVYRSQANLRRFSFDENLFMKPDFTSQGNEIYMTK